MTWQAQPTTDTAKTIYVRLRRSMHEIKGSEIETRRHVTLEWREEIEDGIAKTNNTNESYTAVEKDKLATRPYLPRLV